MTWAPPGCCLGGAQVLASWGPGVALGGAQVSLACGVLLMPGQHGVAPSTGSRDRRPRQAPSAKNMDPRHVTATNLETRVWSP